MPRRNRQHKKTPLSKKNDLDDGVPNVVDDIVDNLQISWRYPKQYSSQLNKKRDIENTVVEFVRYMAREGFHDIGAVSIFSTMHGNILTETIDHIQVRVYAKDGHRWRIRKGRKDRWGALHIPQDRLLWRPALFVEKNA